MQPSELKQDVKIRFATGSESVFDNVKVPSTFIKQCYELDDSIDTAFILEDGEWQEYPRSRWINYRNGGNK